MCNIKYLNDDFNQVGCHMIRNVNVVNLIEFLMLQKTVRN